MLKLNQQQFRQLQDQQQAFKQALKNAKSHQNQPIAQKMNTRPKTQKAADFAPFSVKLKKKAQQLTNGLGWGMGATERMVAMINQALDKPCPYCGYMLSLDSLTVDHKQPILRSKRYKLSNKTSRAQELNSQDNLHIICRKCNLIKREIPHQQFVKLLDFLKTDELLERMILKRLSASNIAYSMSRFQRRQRSNQ